MATLMQQRLGKCWEIVEAFLVGDENYVLRRPLVRRHIAAVPNLGSCCRNRLVELGSVNVIKSSAGRGSCDLVLVGNFAIDLADVENRPSSEKGKTLLDLFPVLARLDFRDGLKQDDRRCLLAPLDRRP